MKKAPAHLAHFSPSIPRAAHLNAARQWRIGSSFPSLRGISLTGLALHLLSRLTPRRRGMGRLNWVQGSVGIVGTRANLETSFAVTAASLWSELNNDL